MPSYRGQDNGVSPQTAELLRMIRSGTAPYQRKRDLMQRAAVGGAQAGLMGVAGIVKAAMAGEEENDRLRAIRSAREADVYKQQSKIDDFQAGLDNAKSDVMKRAIDNARVGNQKLRGTESVEVGPLDASSKYLSESIAGRIDAAEQGRKLPYGDTWNRREFDEADKNASLMAHDIGVGKSLLKGASDWDASGAAVGGPAAEGEQLNSLRGRRGLGGSMRTWGN